MVFDPPVLSGTGDGDDYDFEQLFTRSFGSDDQFEAAFHRSENLFSRTCSIVGAEGWGVSEWQAVASLTVTSMVDWEGSDVDSDTDTNANSKQRK